jgi:AraC family transcriptional activator of pobA
LYVFHTFIPAKDSENEHFESIMTTKTDIPQYDLPGFRGIHRKETPVAFGYNNLSESLRIAGFELYSSEGLISSIGPLKSDFYRISITCNGTLDMQIGLEHYHIQPGTISLTYPNQVFAKNNISEDAFGYYMLFSHDFLDELVSSLQFSGEFPFFDVSGIPLVPTNELELKNIIGLVMSINKELMANGTGRVKAVKMYLYLILLEIKRSYERQGMHLTVNEQDGSNMVLRFRRLVAYHYLIKRQVSDYADMLAVTPNYLNRVIKTITGRTASDTIKSMLLLEAKVLLKNTDQSIAEIAYKLNFGDPASFTRFFKASVSETPSDYRSKPDTDKTKAN